MNFARKRKELLAASERMRIIVQHFVEAGEQETI